jgi:hypothetical protein
MNRETSDNKWVVEVSRVDDGDESVLHFQSHVTLGSIEPVT